MGDNKVGKTAILQRFLYNSFKVVTFPIQLKTVHAVSVETFPLKYEYEKYFSVSYFHARIDL